MRPHAGRLDKAEQAYNDAAVKAGESPRDLQETVEAHTIYMIAGANPNPLTEAHYPLPVDLLTGPSRPS